MIGAWWGLVACGGAETPPPAVSPKPAAPAPAPAAKAGKGGGRKGGVDADCNTSLSSAGGDPGEARCADGCVSQPVYGTDRYTADSRLCAAAVHAGAIPASGGAFRVTVEGASSDFQGSKRHGVESRSWSGEWNPTFRVHDVER